MSDGCRGGEERAGECAELGRQEEKWMSQVG